MNSQTNIKNFIKPITIGNVALKSNLIAAPMAGLSSLPYRLLAMKFGCALAISEMISAEGLIRANEKTHHFYANDDALRPFGVQLFGADPKSMHDAAKILSSVEGIDLIDINMGCPVKKVTSKGAGSAMMKDLGRARDVISSVVCASTKPVTVKMRIGWNMESINFLDLAKIAKECGAKAVTLHPRTRESFFKGVSDWKYIKTLKENTDLIVIGNGDIKSQESALKMFEDTGCDAIMIGRGAIGNPWIFDEILNGKREICIEEKIRTAIDHLAMLRKHLGDKNAVLNMRTMLSWYFKGMRGVKKFMQDVHKIKDPEELKNAIEELGLIANISDQPEYTV